MNNNLISIIIPVYKVEDYLRESLDSVIAQTYQNWEAICVDDGSPDNCGAILDEYAKKDNRFVVIHKENEGTAVAITVAINKSKGKYVTFLDSDDAYAPTFLEKLYNALINNNVDVAYCDRVDGESLPTWEESFNLKNKIYDDVFYNFIKKKSDMWMSLCNKLYERKLFDNLEEIPILYIGEDMCLLYQLMYKAQRSAYVQEKMYFYRKRPNSAMTAKFSQRNIDGVVGFLTYIYEIFKDKKMSLKTRKFLNELIVKGIYKICILAPMRRGKDDVRYWYGVTFPILKELEKKGVFNSKLLPFKCNIRYLILKIIMRL